MKFFKKKKSYLSVEMFDACFNNINATAKLLQNERAQTIAVVLSYASKSTKRKFKRKLPVMLYKEANKRLLDISKVDPYVAREIERVLERRLIK